VWAIAACQRQVFWCGRCELSFIWPRTEQEFADLPESLYYADWEQLNFDGINFLVADVTEERQKLIFGQNDLDARPSVLDVGCGAGQVLVHFRAHGWNVRGVDPWASVAAAGKKYYRLPIEPRRLEVANIAPNSYDVVLSLDVLQFIARPKPFLNSCLEALKPGGLVYLTVPNFGSMESRRDAWKWRYFLPMSYLSYFTVTSIRRLIEATGFVRVQVSPIGGPEGDDFLRVVARKHVPSSLTWSDLSEDIDERLLPPLDRRLVAETSLSHEQHAWRQNGYLSVKGLIPHGLIDRYCAVRSKISRAGGWISPTPYLDVPEIRDLCLYMGLTDLLEHLLGEQMGLHLNLTGWVSTERDWHQDDYLNPSGVNGHYCGVWTALDRISPDSGPFEFVPKSHLWPIIRQSKVLSQLGYDNGDNRNWPWESERILTSFFEREIKKSGLNVERFLGQKGDVLIWHARLLHRGSLPERRNAERRSMIAHYSGITSRQDMPIVRRHSSGGVYFVP
jgi:2-polyprenyl-3-methyl-5-hydroxy-6-metoxy-1,4-benzoquinol methylase